MIDVPETYTGVTPVTYWTVRCVNCHKDALEHDEWTAWGDAAGAEDAADNAGYIRGTDGRWRCPGCTGTHA